MIIKNRGGFPRPCSVRRGTCGHAYDETQQQPSEAAFAFSLRLALVGVGYIFEDCVLLAQEPALLIAGRHVGVEFVDELIRALALCGERLPDGLDLGQERYVVGYDFSDVTLRSLYLPALGQRCGSVRRI